MIKEDVYYFVYLLDPIRLYFGLYYCSMDDLGAPGISLSPRAQASFSPVPTTTMALLFRSTLILTRLMVNSMNRDSTVQSTSSPVSFLNDFTPRQAASPSLMPS